MLFRELIREERKAMDSANSIITSGVAGSTPEPMGGTGGEKMAAVGGIAGALAASACCILPLVLFSFGVGGVWVGRLAALSPYQPYFVGFAAVSIGYGFWKVYRQPATACAAGAACARPLPKRLVKTALWSATALVVIALIYPYALPYLL